MMGNNIRRFLLQREREGQKEREREMDVLWEEGTSCTCCPLEHSALYFPVSQWSKSLTTHNTHMHQHTSTGICAHNSASAVGAGGIDTNHKTSFTKQKSSTICPNVLGFVSKILRKRLLWNSVNYTCTGSISRNLYVIDAYLYRIM